MSKTIRVKPRPGVILAGIPAAGTDVDAKLAKEWIDNGLATEIEEPKEPDKPADKPKEA